ncbi:MAG TPA: type II toxin-antitoxin system VapC family toxin [Longimicrobiaceae bacterium]
MVFWDTSALVKAYALEPGTPTVQAALRSAPVRAASSISDVVALEMLSVIAKKMRAGTFSPADYIRARTEFYGDYPQSFVSIPLRRQIRRHALALAETHRTAGVGALDILHLACPLHVRSAVHPRPAVLAVVDGPLRRVATSEGLRTFNPETQSVTDLLTALR